jgi:hypothetical protein
MEMSKKSQSAGWPSSGNRQPDFSLKTAQKDDMPFVDAAWPFV